MTANNSTTMIDEKLTEDELSKLRVIRRSSMAIRSCAEILNEHYANEASIPSGPRVFICLDVNQVKNRGHPHLFVKIIALLIGQTINQGDICRVCSERLWVSFVFGSESLWVSFVFVGGSESLWVSFVFYTPLYS